MSHAAAPDLVHSCRSVAEAGRVPAPLLIHLRLLSSGPCASLMHHHLGNRCLVWLRACRLLLYARQMLTCFLPMLTV